MSSRTMVVLGLIGLAVSTAGCTSMSSNYTGAMTVPSVSRIYVCHGFDCTYKSKLDLGPADSSRFGTIMAAGAGSPDAERSAISKAVQYYEDRSFQVIGIRDGAKSAIGQAARGQMDCIDESTNTHSLLVYLNERKLLKYHAVEGNVSRGFFADGRYPHSTAVLRENAGGQRWAVDSWYEPMGGPPDIMPLDKWMTRGVMGER